MTAAKPWRLTRRAEAALADIARWTIQTFGARQAAAYEDDLITLCHALAAGEAISQSCQRVIAADLPADLRLARSGQHFVIFVETAEQIIITDVLHVRADLPRQLSATRQDE